MSIAGDRWERLPLAPEGRHVYSRRQVLFSLNRGLHGLKDYTDKAENGRWNP